jgi:hypothetical protein
LLVALSSWVIELFILIGLAFCPPIVEHVTWCMTLANCMYSCLMWSITPF